MARDKRSPAYPVFGIEDAIRTAEVFYSHTKGHAIPASSAYEACGYAGKNGSSLQAIATLKQYGLLTTEIEDSVRQTRLTELALGILRDTRENSEERSAAIREAARAPYIMNELINQFGSDLPSDGMLETDLKLKHGYSDKAAPIVVRLLGENIAYCESLGKAIVQYNEANQDDDVIRVPYEVEPDREADPVGSDTNKPQVDMALAGGGRLVLNMHMSGTIVTEAEANLVRGHVENILSQMVTKQDRPMISDNTSA